MLKIVDMKYKYGTKNDIPESYGFETDDKLKKIQQANQKIDIHTLINTKARKISTFEGDIIGSNDDIDFLNGLNFLRSISEVARRACRKENKRNDAARELDSFPAGIIQARTSHLLMTKKIETTDAYGIDCENKYYSSIKQSMNKYGELFWPYLMHNAPFGAFTGKKVVDNIEEVKKKVSRINEKYNEQYTLIQIDKDSYITEGRKFLRKKLGEEFGSDSESDEEDYSDTEMEELQNTKKIIL